MIFGYNVDKIRQEFPILKKPIIYFDNACMSLKPKQVIDKINEYYTSYTACSGRSSHKFANEVGVQVAKSRNEVRKLINAKLTEEIIFTRNTTEGINLVANSFGLEKGDEIIISDKEHNSNLLPWLRLKEKIGIKVIVVDSNLDNTFNLENFEKCFSNKTRLVSVAHTSNLDGVTNPIKDIAEVTQQKNALLLVDGAQSVPGKEVDVKALGIDFLSFSGHKMLGPTGIGVLYGRIDLLEKLDQFIVGGETVIDSTYNDFKLEKLPNRLEAGLQDYTGIIGLSEACKFLKKVGLKKIENHGIKLNKLSTEALVNNENIELIGQLEPEKRSGIFSFNIKGKDMHHVSRILDTSKNIMTRSGAHCVHSWFNKHEMKGSVRASLYLYNTAEEVQVFVDEIKKIIKL